MTTIALFRHGRTVWHSPNRYAGSSDVDLDGTGRAQAQSLAEWAVAAKPTGLACSDLRRAVDTATPARDRTGLPLHIDPRLRELDFGIAEGHTLAELRQSHPDAAGRFVADPDGHHFPGGERPADAVARAWAALGELAAADPAGRILVVAHNTLIRLLLCDLLGAPLREYRRRLSPPAPLSRTELELVDGRARLLAYNLPPLTAAGPALAGWTP